MNWLKKWGALGGLAAMFFTGWYLVSTMPSGNVIGADLFRDSATPVNKRMLYAELKQGDTSYYAPTVNVGKPESFWVYNESPDWSGLTGSTVGLIVVDLDGTTAYRHTKTDYIIVDELYGTVCLDANTSMWEFSFGVLNNNTAGGGDVSFFWSRIFTGKGCDQFMYKPWTPVGVSLQLDGSTTIGFVTGRESNDGIWGSSENMWTYLWQLKHPGKGDLVVYIREIFAGPANIGFASAISYRTR